MIMPNRLDRGFRMYQKEFEDKALEVLRSGWYILGKEVKGFEEEFARFTGSRYCVGLSSGLDALWIAFRALGIGRGDEVIVQGNTYIASVMGITINGALPVFVEPDAYYNLDADKIEEKITARTKAVLAVHLYGQASNMEPIVGLCKKYQLKLVEDCAQSHGARFWGKMTGTFGDIGCFSFYPSKNLGAFGDAGAIVTDQEQIAEQIRTIRNYGNKKRYMHQVVGANARLDELQAGLLRVRLSHLEQIQQRRKSICQRYLHELSKEQIVLPQVREGAEHVWHQFVIRTKQRTQLMRHLEKQEIGTLIHYPIPPHLSQAYAYLGMREGDLPITEQYAREVLSLPLYDGMTSEEVSYVVEMVNRFAT